MRDLTLQLSQLCLYWVGGVGGRKEGEGEGGKEGEEGGEGEGEREGEGRGERGEEGYSSFFAM